MEHHVLQRKGLLKNLGTPTIIKKQGLLKNSNLYKNMNPAYNRTLSLLVEIKSNIPGRGDGSYQEPDDLGPLGKAKPSKKMSTITNAPNRQTNLDFVQPKQSDEAPKKNSVWKKMLGAFVRFFGRNKPK